MNPRRFLSIGIAILVIVGLALLPDMRSALLASGVPAVALGAPRFVEETSSAGIDHLYLAGGGRPAALYRNDSPVGGTLRFTRLPDPATDLARVTGAYPIDIDGDGIVDLVVLRNGDNVLLRGLGGCRFERANEGWGYAGNNSITMAFSATWETGAAFPTLAFGNYVNPASDDPHHLCFDNELVRPSTVGRRLGPATALTPSWCTLSMLFSDWNRSGRMDLRVSNDAHYYLPTDGEEQLWRVAPGQPPSLYTADDGWVKVQVQGMGIASYDLTGDGYPEVFLTSQADNRLQTLSAGPTRPTYRDIGLKRGANAAQPFMGGDTRPSTAWHDEFADVNNDGFIDLFIAKGNVTDQVEYAQKDPSNLLIGRQDGTFREAAAEAGIVSFDRGRGAALADLNLDGMLDLVEIGYGAPVRTWRNVGGGDAAKPNAMGNWLALRVAQPGPNADAIGAWVEVRLGDQTMRRELTVGGGHSGGQLGWVHFGVGTSAGADVRVLWPGGEIGPWLRVPANEFTVVQRGDATARRWSPTGS
jgi:hypothetical protein